jgi:O-antigen ligase
MSAGPGGPSPVSIDEIRLTAKRQARTLSTGLVAAIAMTLALVVVGLFVMLDYRFGQDAHRLIKILLGVTFIGTIIVRPRIGLFMLPVLTPFLGWLPRIPIPGVNTLNILLFSVFFSWAVTRAFHREPVFRNTRLGLIVLAMVALAALSIVRGSAFPTGYAYSGGVSTLELTRSVMTFAIYFITLSMARGPADRRKLAAAIVLGLLLETAVTILYGRSGRGARATGSFGQSNDLGTYLAIFTAFSAALIVGVRSLWAKLALWVAVFGGIFGVVLSVSRGAIVALVVALAFVALRSSRFMTLILVAAAISSPLWAPDYLKQRMTGTQVAVEGADQTELEGSAQMRIDTWRAVWKVVSEHPLEGVGFTGLAYVLPETGEAMGVEVKDSAHNTFLRFLAEMGILGLVLFLLVLWKCWSLAMDGMRHASTRFDRQLSLGLAAATLGLAVSCAFGDRFFNILITGCFWLLCALVNDLVIEQGRRA